MAKKVVIGVLIACAIVFIALASYAIGISTATATAKQKLVASTTPAVPKAPEEKPVEPIVSIPDEGQPEEEEEIYENDGPGEDYVPQECPLPSGLEVTFDSNFQTIESPVWLGVTFKNTSGAPTPGGMKFKVKLDEGLCSEAGGNSNTIIVGGCLYGLQYSEKLLGEGFTLPRLLPGSEAGVSIDVRQDVNDPPPANPSSPIMAFLWLKGEQDADWYLYTNYEWWY